jgi:hypothetical protein
VTEDEPVPKHPRKDTDDTEQQREEQDITTTTNTGMTECLKSDNIPTTPAVVKKQTETQTQQSDPTNKQSRSDKTEDTELSDVESLSFNDSYRILESSQILKPGVYRDKTMIAIDTLCESLRNKWDHPISP